jgi:hypothetical protein
VWGFQHPAQDVQHAPHPALHPAQDSNCQDLQHPDAPVSAQHQAANCQHVQHSDVRQLVQHCCSNVIVSWIARAVFHGLMQTILLLGINASFFQGSSWKKDAISFKNASTDGGRNCDGTVWDIGQSMAQRNVLHTTQNLHAVLHKGQTPALLSAVNDPERMQFCEYRFHACPVPLLYLVNSSCTAVCSPFIGASQKGTNR